MPDGYSREAYTAYGKSTYGSFEKKRYRFTGKERDEESGLNYHSARYYAPWLGKWLSPDPSGFVDGPNLYAYVRGNPISLSDPTGREGEDQAPTAKPSYKPTGIYVVDDHDLLSALGVVVGGDVGGIKLSLVKNKQTRKEIELATGNKQSSFAEILINEKYSNTGDPLFSQGFNEIIASGQRVVLVTKAETKNLPGLSLAENANVSDITLLSENAKSRIHGLKNSPSSETPDLSVIRVSHSKSPETISKAGIVTVPMSMSLAHEFQGHFHTAVVLQRPYGHTDLGSSDPHKSGPILESVGNHALQLLQRKKIESVPLFATFRFAARLDLLELIAPAERYSK
ncbi:MAG: RHS repeat-associated core domain-containing protein [bacterium]